MNETITLYGALRAHAMGTLGTMTPDVLRQYEILLNARIAHHLNLISSKDLNVSLRAELSADMRWYNAILSRIKSLLGTCQESEKAY